MDTGRCGPWRRGGVGVLRNWLGEPGEDFVEGGTDTHDVAAMELQDRLVAALIGVVNDPDRVRAHRVADAVLSVIKMEAARQALPCAADIPLPC